MTVKNIRLYDGEDGALYIRYWGAQTTCSLCLDAREQYLDVNARIARVIARALLQWADAQDQHGSKGNGHE